MKNWHRVIALHFATCKAKIKRKRAKKELNMFGFRSMFQKLTYFFFIFNILTLNTAC